jgi:signal transduction histidine kinase
VVRAGRVLASPRGVALAAETMPSASFHGDEDLIRRLLVNLLDNAVRHAPRGSTVRIELAPTSAGYAIAISDEGPGIAPEQQARIFELPARTA